MQSVPCCRGTANASARKMNERTSAKGCNSEGDCESGSERKVQRSVRPLSQQLAQDLSDRQDEKKTQCPSVRPPEELSLRSMSVEVPACVTAGTTWWVGKDVNLSLKSGFRSVSGLLTVSRPKPFFSRFVLFQRYCALLS